MLFRILSFSQKHNLKKNVFSICTNEEFNILIVDYFQGYRYKKKKPYYYILLKQSFCMQNLPSNNELHIFCYNSLRGVNSLFNCLQKCHLWLIIEQCDLQYQNYAFYFRLNTSRMKKSFLFFTWWREHHCGLEKKL